MEKQNVGPGTIGNKLRYYNGFDDVYAAGRNLGRDIRSCCFDSNVDAIFWNEKNY